MAREFFIFVYLLLFHVIFAFCSIFPVKRKITFVVSFKQNSLFVYNELKKQSKPFQVTFVCTPSCYQQVAKEVKQKKVFLFDLKKPWHFISSIYHIATSQYVIVDNYYGFLSTVSFKKGVECIQLWHAAGAIKTFGLSDKSIHMRSKGALHRFKKVYAQFDHVVIGSEKMKHIFMEAFGLSSEKFLLTGIPRTDLFFEKERKEAVVKHIYRRYPALKNKKVILYAPTFRDGQLDKFDLKLDLSQMHKAFKDTYALIVKLHPAVKKNADLSRYPGFVIDCTDYDDVNELLLITDVLITDYSSIPFEFSILNRPMIFYPYDLEAYQETRGFWESYDQLVPGPVAYQTGEIIKLIKSGSFDYRRIEAFSKLWNTYSTGHSSRNLVQYLYHHEENKVHYDRGD
ncbi:CDP-glycerol glycerophosphotransferase family protein [Heyndrickxia acidiproducens]|uniref:CDP-glycerol glycerophosphotransferase family protein n=1 Tax=Heyndrickxia acidiproducens TaxID=1121084 RepID=UPI00037E87FF|nr:CDP-glycerol glycerophosphotransferase family protein [Heyndrickxia acidiproducens]